MKFTVNTVPLPTVLPPESLVAVETSGAGAAAVAGPENASMSPASANATKSPEGTQRAPSDPGLLLPAAVTGIILAPHGGRAVAQTPGMTVIFLRSRWGDFSHTADFRLPQGCPLGRMSTAALSEHAR